MIVTKTYHKQPEGWHANDFGKALEEAVLKYGAKRDGDTTKKTFAPSTIGYGHGHCPRYWHMAFNGVEFTQKADPIGIRKMQKGTKIHETWDDVLNEEDFIEAIEKEVTLEDPPIRAFIDLIVNWNGKRVIGEIKSANHNSFLWKMISNKPYQNQILQVLIYMYIEDTDTGFILYDDNDTSEVNVVTVFMSPENRMELEKVLDWLRMVKRTWDDQQALPEEERTLPKRQYRENSVVCKKCPIKEPCFALGKEGLDIPVMEALDF